MNDKLDSTAAVVALLTAILGGALSTIRANSLLLALLGLIVAGISGLVAWFAITQMMTPGPFTAVFIGLSGHVGAEIVRLITSEVKQ